MFPTNHWRVIGFDPGEGTPVVMRRVGNYQARTGVESQDFPDLLAVSGILALNLPGLLPGSRLPCTPIDPLTVDSDRRDLLWR